MTYSAIDLHANNSVVVVTDEDDRVVAQYLSWAFIEAAHFAQRYCAEAKRFYERKKARTNTIVATKALAHKLARACYHMLKQGQGFDVKRCFA
jgi:transposase